MSKELRELIEAVGIKRNQVWVFPSGSDFLNHEFDVNPEDFLEQAEQDYETGRNAALLNSITNAKRAIRCQIDKVVFCLGYDARSMRIASKIKLLKDLGFVAPRILRKVDDARNLLEHRYQNPNMEEVEDALDIAALFVEATNRSINPIGSQFKMGNADEYIEETDHFLNEIFFWFRDDEKHFLIWGFRNLSGREMNRNNKKAGEVIISPDTPIYLDILRLAITVEKERETKTKNALEKFFDALERQT